jgi:hypothetical protein
MAVVRFLGLLGRLAGFVLQLVPKASRLILVLLDFVLTVIVPLASDLVLSVE